MSNLIQTQAVGNATIENEFDSNLSIEANLAGSPAVPIASTPRSLAPPEPESDHEPINSVREDSVDVFQIGSPTPSIDMSTHTFAGPVIPDTVADHHSWITTNTAWPATNPDLATEVAPDRTSLSFHSETRFSSGEPGILLDIGSVGNLGGDAWARDVSKSAIAHGRVPTQTVRDRVMKVSGVGEGSQECTHNVVLPVAFQKIDNRHSKGQFTIPVVPNSQLPGLLGLQSMRDRRTVLDLSTLQCHFLGPGDCNLLPLLPPGTESYQCELSPSGHMLLPCGKYAGVDREEAGSLDTGPALALPILPAPMPVPLWMDDSIPEFGFSPVDNSSSGNEQPPRGSSSSSSKRGISVGSSSSDHAGRQDVWQKYPSTKFRHGAELHTPTESADE